MEDSMHEDVYKRLRLFMDRLPAGFPETPTGVKIKLLKKMFTPEEAEFVMLMSSEPESLADMARRTGMDESELSAMLENMAVKGLIFRVYRGNERLYQAYQFMIGLYEFQINRLNKEFCELFEEYMPYVGLASTRVTRQYRVIPVDSALKTNSHVSPYNRIREIVRNEELIALTRCICKKEQELLGHACDKPQEVCLMFGNWARFYIDNGYGRSISVQEALEVLDIAEENGLVLTCSNSQKLETLCCCCPTLKNIKILRSPAKFMVSYYRAAIDPNECVGCSACVEHCPMAAISEEDGFFHVLEKRCIGCGLCANHCPTEAISLINIPGKDETPLPTVEHIMERIASERGLS
jgi:NAD-dependent dihydropyrimidine dehydrogenase PreA subunit